jgi:hypothetical protein
MVNGWFEHAEHLERDQIYRVHLEASVRGHSRDLDVEHAEKPAHISERSEVRSQASDEQVRPSVLIEVFCKFPVREDLVQLREEDPLELGLLHRRHIKSNLHDLL